MDASKSLVQITETVNSAHRCFITIWWLKLVYRSGVQRRSCIVCSGSSNQHPGGSLPWVTAVSDTLSAAYMPPTPPLLHPSLCAFSLFPLCTVLPPLLSQDCFSPFLLSPSLTLLPSVFFFSSFPCLHFFSASSSSSLMSFYSNWLSFKNSPPPISSSLHLTPYPSFSFLFPFSWLDSIGVCALAPSGQSRHEGGRGEGVVARVPFSIRTKHACGASRHQLEMQSGPLSWHTGWGRGVVRGTGGRCCVVGLQSECYRSWEIPGCFPGPSPSFKLGHLGENRSRWPAMRKTNSVHGTL